jgi:TRAP-type mannitol/chloroaromatic compound transport system substrate-binding protein
MLYWCPTSPKEREVREAEHLEETVVDRRKVLKGAGLAAVSSVVASPATAQAQPEIRWRMASAYPKNLDTLYGAGEMIAKRIAAATDGKFQIQMFGPGEIVGALQTLDATQNGTIECAYVASNNFIGKDLTFMFETSVPWGMNVRQHNAWMYHGGGLELVREFMKDYNVYPIPAGQTGAQMGGWFRKEIRSVEDLKGLKMRVVGMGGQIMAKLGVVPQLLPAGDIYPALERGTLDAAEFTGPYDDEKLGFVKVAQYYYYPGFCEGSAQISVMINMDKWQSLPPSYKAIVEAACAEANVMSVAKYDAQNAEAIRRLVGQGAQLRPFPKDVLDQSYKEAFKLYSELAASNPKFKKIFDAWNAFREKELTWFRVAELPFDFNVSSQQGQQR